MLRAGRHPTNDDHPHSHLSNRLYAELIEADLMKDARLARLTAWSAMHSHPDSDLEKAGRQMQLHFIDAMSTIPYVTGGLSGQDALHKERMDAVKQYQEYNLYYRHHTPPRTRRI